MHKTCRKLYAFLETYIRQNHYAPTYDEICAGIGLSTKSNIKVMLSKLKAAGLIDFVDGEARAIWLAVESSRTIRLPNYGRISAGAPIPQQQDQDPAGYIDVPLSQLPKGVNPHSLFVLKVDGDSMQDASIEDGDLVVLDKSATPREGDTLAFWLKDELATTLKRFVSDGEYVILQPANPKYQAKRKHRDLVESYGKVVLVIRQLGMAA